MRILLVNFALIANHGGILQCYALQEVLKGMGHHVVKVDLDRREFRFTLHQFLVTIKRILIKCFVTRHRVSVFYEYYLDRKRKYIQQNTDRFIKHHLQIIRVDSMDELKGSDFDAVIVGSDQVWRKSYADKLLSSKSAEDNAFLAFTSGWNCKRIAYATSMGVDKWEFNEQETEILRQLIVKFDAISVREDSAISLLQQNLSSTIPIEHVLDPTLLLDKQIYIDLFEKTNTPKSAGDMLVYILDPDETKNGIVSQMAAELKLTPFVVNNPKFERGQYPVKERVQTSIEQWLRGFYDAKYVVADSFHACVFSIIFERPFVVIANSSRGIARIDSLLRMFGLGNRMVYGLKDLQSVPAEIDWKAVKQRHDILKEKSMHFLLKALIQKGDLKS